MSIYKWTSVVVLINIVAVVSLAKVDSLTLLTNDMPTVVASSAQQTYEQAVLDDKACTARPKEYVDGSEFFTDSRINVTELAAFQWRLLVRFAFTDLRCGRSEIPPRHATIQWFTSTSI